VSAARVALLAAFDLLVNAVGSFAVAAIVVALAVRALRVGPGRAARVLWSVPFAKVVWDAAHGIPSGAFFWVRIAGTPQRLGTFMVGAGFKYVFPLLSFGLAALTDRGRYPSTIGDLAAVLLGRRVSPSAPLFAAGLLVGVGVARVAVRVARLVHGEGERGRLRAGALSRWGRERPQTPGPLRGTLHLGVRRVGRRDVEVYASGAHQGAPFTGGVFRPYVCFPLATFDALSPAEREACLAHELAHVAHRDLLLAIALDLMGDLLWFVPGRGAVRRRIDASCEHLADLAAVRSGVSPLDLATALVRVRDALLAAPATPASTLVRPRSQLARRVAALLGRAPRPRWGLDRPWASAALTAWVAAAALLSSLFGH
jgi:BlaR1 peptidase M56